MQALPTTLRSRISLAMLLFVAGCASQQRGFVFDVTADMREFTPPQHAGAAYFG